MWQSQMVYSVETGCAPLQHVVLSCDMLCCGGTPSTHALFCKGMRRRFIPDQGGLPRQSACVHAYVCAHAHVCACVMRVQCTTCVFFLKSKVARAAACHCVDGCNVLYCVATPNTVFQRVAQRCNILCSVRRTAYRPFHPWGSCGSRYRSTSWRYLGCIIRRLANRGALEGDLGT